MEPTLMCKNKENDEKHPRTIEDYIEENKLLLEKLNTVTEQLALAQSRLHKERKLQDLKLSDLGVRLLEFEEDLRKDQRKVKRLLKTKDEQLKKQSKTIEFLKCQVNAYESKYCRVSSGNRVELEVSPADDPDSPMSPENGNHPNNAGTPKSRDLSHLLYLDLNTDQFSGGRRYFRHRDLSPVAEVREDVEDFLNSPSRVTPKKQLCDPESCSPKPCGEMFRFDHDVTTNNKQGDNWSALGSSETRFNDSTPSESQVPANEFTDVLMSHISDELSPTSMFGINNEPLNISQISDQDSDNVRKIVMSNQEGNLLSDGILNSSLEDHMLNITNSNDDQQGNNCIKYRTDSTSHLIRAEKEIRRSLIIDDVDDFDDKDEFYDCPSIVTTCIQASETTDVDLHFASKDMTQSDDKWKDSKHNGWDGQSKSNSISGDVSNATNVMKTMVESNVPKGEQVRTEPSAETDTSLCQQPGSLPKDISRACIPEHCFSGTDSPDSASSASLKEEWADAPENISAQVSRESSLDKDVNNDDFAVDANTIEPEKTNHLSNDQCLNQRTDTTVTEGNVYENGTNEIPNGGCFTQGLTAKKQKGNKNRDLTASPGVNALDEYDVIDIDVTTSL